MPERLPEGNGIAAGYPGDVGIENDPAVVFADGFEEIEGDAMAAFGKDQKGNRWDTCANTVTIVTEPEQVHSGSKAAQVTFEKVGSHNAVKQFKPGFDTLFLRYYMKYHPKYPGCHHSGLLILAGAPGITLAKGSATGVVPDGRNHFEALVDTMPPGQHRHLLLPQGSGAHMGRPVLPHRGRDAGREQVAVCGEFDPRPNMNVERGRWYCYELMLKANTPGERDGRVALWIDGKLAGDFPNLRFRSVDELKPNHIIIVAHSSSIQPN